MSNSKLVNYTKLTPHCTKGRKHKIDTITIHHMAGNISVETCGQVFLTRQASANYGVDGKGRVGLYVDEGDRAWSTAKPTNDNRAVNIEVANCGGAPDWPVSDAALDKLIELVADICKRNGIKKLVWGETRSDRTGHKNGCNMTVHQDFMATSCPGPYLLERMPRIAAEVNKLLGADGSGNPQPAPDGADKPLFAAPYTVRVSVTDLPILSGPGSDFPRRGLVPPGVYTIVAEQDGFGRLKSGAGWIELARTTKTG